MISLRDLHKQSTSTSEYTYVQFDEKFMEKHQNKFGWKGCGGEKPPLNFYYRGEWFYYGGSLVFELNYNSHDNYLYVPLKHATDEILDEECLTIIK